MAGFEPPAYAVEVEGMVAYAYENINHVGQNCEGPFESRVDNIYTVRCGSLQMVSESIPTLVWGFVWPYRRCLTIWPHNPVGHNKDFVSTLGERKQRREPKLGLGLWLYGPQAQRATAFHFLVSKRLIFLDEEDEGETENNGPAVPDPSPAGITVMSMSMAQKERVSERKLGVRALFA
uniref:Uncharacterized protein n=1 Tax=Vitis vinifera TaxID=29760 RepID=A5C2T6_VITVI|nr:hypothetical protein VITISV_014209 [Vitis vinifera]